MVRLRWAGKLDMYRKIPADLMEGTRRGSVLSYVAAVVMAVLFLMETKAFFQKSMVTDLALDANDEKRVRLNFNITMMDLKCEFTSVDVVSVLGTEQNITNHVSKWHVDAEGVRQRYQGRNKLQNDIELYDEKVQLNIEELHEDGEDAVSLDHDTLKYARREQEYVFVDFYASWCSHCRQLAPTWETLAEVMNDVADDIVGQHEHEYSDEEYQHAKKVHLPVMIAKVDCVVHGELCRDQNIMAYPTLRLFVDGHPWRAGDYRGHRTVVGMTDWLEQVEELHKEETGSAKNKTVAQANEAAKEFMREDDDLNENDETKEEERHEWLENVKKQRRRMNNQWVDSDHPGCQIAGHLMLDRVPGNFHIQARSPHHDLVPHMTNVSHEIHHLSIGEPMVEKMLLTNKVDVPADVKRKITPVDGNVYVTRDLHEAYHHYLKVVTTNVDGLKIGRRNFKAYQILQSSQLSFYRNDQVPEAKFIIDLSPIAVSYRKTSRHWYDYFTSVMAIVGGTFTVVGLIETSISSVVNRKKSSYR